VPSLNTSWAGNFFHGSVFLFSFSSNYDLILNAEPAAGLPAATRGLTSVLAFDRVTRAMRSPHRRLGLSPRSWEV
jgi:hypothetical protein